jgi:hypothetical protein
VYHDDLAWISYPMNIEVPRGSTPSQIANGAQARAIATQSVLI